MRSIHLQLQCPIDGGEVVPRTEAKKAEETGIDPSDFACSCSLTLVFVLKLMHCYVSISTQMTGKS